MRIARNDADRALAEKFCETHPRGHFMQSTGWAKVKVNWKNEIIIAENGSGQIIGMLSVLARKIPFFGNLMYCPRGPVCDIHDADVLGQLRDGAAVGFLEITDENDPHSGLYCFKKRFGGEMTHYIGEVMIPYRPVAYRLYRVAEKALFTYRQNKTGGNRHEKRSNGNDEKGDFWHHGTRDALGTFLPIGLHEAGNRRG